MFPAGCGGESGPATPSPPRPSSAAQAGEALFHDKSLSASGQQSCASCHVPERAFTADPHTDDGLPVPLGGAPMDLPGFRNAPSLMYASLTPAFFMDEGTPTAGFFRDGRASLLAVQARQPFVSSFEMANPNAAEAVTVASTAARTPTRCRPPPAAPPRRSTAAEIDQLVAFLCTLTDGYDPAHPAACHGPAQCQPGAD